MKNLPSYPTPDMDIAGFWDGCLWILKAIMWVPAKLLQLYAGKPFAIQISGYLLLIGAITYIIFNRKKVLDYYLTINVIWLLVKIAEWTLWPTWYSISTYVLIHQPESAKYHYYMALHTFFVAPIAACYIWWFSCQSLLTQLAIVKYVNETTKRKDPKNLAQG